MKFRRMGRLFNPSEYELPADCFGYAQSPQALVLEDRVRIFFSARSKDEQEKFISHVCFVDVTHDFRQVLGTGGPVIGSSELGAFDEHGIFPLNPVRHKNRLLGFTTGWSRRVSVSVETGIGMVKSEDNGLKFDRVGIGPVMSSSLREPCLVGDAFVISKNESLHMWYIKGAGWKQAYSGATPDRIYKIAYATSDNDGVTWHRGKTHQLIPDILDENECQALPTVIEIDDYFHMVFCFREAFDFRKGKGRGYRLGYAYSRDMLSWTRDDQKFSFVGGEGDWESDMECYPHLVRVNSEVFILYNGNEFGKYGFGVAKLIT
ncbi:hypothetical protein OAC04_03480 [Gammaproteobacteria bacterium]|nr:hypothetical protein [Gammaproteobacteria bacterium]